MNSVDEVAEWEVLEMAVDSGAGETVVGEEMIGAVKAVPGEAQKKGVRYEVADGTLLENLGEKRFEVICEGGLKKRMVAQVCGVNKALLSVRRVTAAGNTVVFKKGFGWIQEDATGEKIWMEEKEGMYIVKWWVPKVQKSF